MTETHGGTAGRARLDVLDDDGRDGRDGRGRGDLLTAD